MTVRVVFHGVKRRTGEMMIDLYRGYDPILKKGVEVAVGKEIDNGISEEFFAELRVDYPGAFEMVNAVAAPKVVPVTKVKAVPDNGVPPVVKAQPVVRGEMPILFANGIGNAVLLTPAFRGLAEKGYEPVLYIGDKDERFEAIAGIFPFPVKRESELPEGAAAHLMWSDRSFFTNLNRFKCHEMPIPKWGEVHEAQYYLDFFGIEKKYPTQVVAKRRVSLRVGKDEKLIGLANGSDHPKGIKKWNVDHWVELAGALIKRGHQLAFLGSMKEKKEVGNELLKRYGSKVWNLAGEFSLTESADALSQCNAFVTTDSALMHIADALGVKTLCLWGPTLWTKNHPWNGNGTMLSAKVDCAPCFGKKLYFSCGTERCMIELTPKMVLEAFDAL